MKILLKRPKFLLERTFRKSSAISLKKVGTILSGYMLYYEQFKRKGQNPTNVTISTAKPIFALKKTRLHYANRGSSAIWLSKESSFECWVGNKMQAKTKREARGTRCAVLSSHSSSTYSKQLKIPVEFNVFCQMHRRIQGRKAVKVRHRVIHFCIIFNQNHFVTKNASHWFRLLTKFVPVTNLNLNWIQFIPNCKTLLRSGSKRVSFGLASGICTQSMKLEIRFGLDHNRPR